MSRHFLNLEGAATVDTDFLSLTRRAVADIAAHRALGVVHGAAGLGKTFAVEAAPAPLRSPAYGLRLGVATNQIPATLWPVACPGLESPT
jgi:hypothetical protein